MKQNTIYYVGKSKTSKMFIGKNNRITDNPNQAYYFKTIGDCMVACVHVNKNLGTTTFKAEEVSRVG